MQRGVVDEHRDDVPEPEHHRGDEQRHPQQIRRFASDGADLERRLIRATLDRPAGPQHGRVKCQLAARIKRERRIMVNAQESGTRTPGSCSTRNRSTQATSGRNSSWSYSRITTSMVHDRPADGREILLLDGERDIGTDSRQRDGGVSDA